MKIIATLLAAIVLTFSGLLAPHAAAAGEYPNDPTVSLSCEDAREWWMVEALEGHAEIEVYHEAWESARADVRQAERRADRFERVAERRQERIQRLREKIRELRNR